MKKTRSSTSGIKNFQDLYQFLERTSQTIKQQQQKHDEVARRTKQCILIERNTHGQYLVNRLGQAQDKAIACQTLPDVLEAIRQLYIAIDQDVLMSTPTESPLQ